MTRYDSNGLPYAVQLGGDHPPRHLDWSLVITPRLWAKLTPVERAIWSGDDFRALLATRAYWITSGELIDGWDAEDFASYGLERAVGLDSLSNPAVSQWMREEITRHRKRQALVPIEPLYRDHPDGSLSLIADRPAEEYIPDTLPDWTRVWLDKHLSPRTAVAVRLYIEKGLTQVEAAEAAGVDARTLQRAFLTLRDNLTEGRS